ncbi:MAG: hypothetical protein J7499_18340 [Sphingopyxis sp.]|nr:hypothetical protein [Sphingopyxis sp.]
MPFDTLNLRLQAVAAASFGHCKARYGTAGAKAECEIDKDIGWKPTFHVKSGVKIIAVEVDDNLYPEILKIAAHDIGKSEKPIVVYQACSLEAFMLDKKQTQINKLKKDGFGIITVDDQNNVTIQNVAVPLVQHISEDDLDREIKGLTQKIKVAFRAAHTTYASDAGQGLQLSGQIIEALVIGIAKAMKKKGLAINPNRAVADVIDDIYAETTFAKYRGAGLGGARDFIKEFRNIASHPSGNAKLAALKLKKCKAGFFDATKLAKKLRDIAKKENLSIQFHVV